MVGHRREIGDTLLAPGPVDPVKAHAAPDHLRFQIGGVLHPVRSFADPKSCFLTYLVQFVVDSQCPSGSMVHHQKAVIGERLIIHGTPIRRVVPRCGDSFCSQNFNDFLRRSEKAGPFGFPNWSPARLTRSKNHMQNPGASGREIAKQCAPLPPRATRVAGRGRGWGVYQQETLLQCMPHLPPPPNPSPPLARGEGSGRS